MIITNKHENINIYITPASVRMILIRGRAVRDIGNSIKVYMLPATGASLYRRCLFPNEFHKSLTASLMYLQSSRQRLVLFLFSIYFQWFLQTFIILKLSEQKPAFLFFILILYSNSLQCCFSGCQLVQCTLWYLRFYALA